MIYIVSSTDFECREIAFISTFELWMFSVVFDICAESFTSIKVSYIIVYLKDLLFIIDIVLYNVFLYRGIYNRCSCWIKFEHDSLCFELEPQMTKELQKKISNDWLSAIIRLITWQIIIVLLVCALSHKGVVMLLFSVKSDFSREKKDNRTDWRYVSSNRYDTPQWWWRKMRATQHVENRKWLLSWRWDVTGPMTESDGTILASLLSN